MTLHVYLNSRELNDWNLPPIEFDKFGVLKSLYKFYGYLDNESFIVSNIRNTAFFKDQA